MRLHIVLDDELVAQLDARAGRGGPQPLRRGGGAPAPRGRTPVGCAAAVDRLRLLRHRADAAATSAVNVDEVVRGLRPAEQRSAGQLLDGGRLATGNPRHFPMPELDVERWPVGA